MNTQEFLDNISRTYATGLTIIQKKNQDYANSTNPFKNFESALVVGIQPDRAILLRVMDKIARVSNLLDKEAAVKDESLEDTLIDCINYLAILKAYRERNIATPIQGHPVIHSNEVAGIGGRSGQRTEGSSQSSRIESAIDKYKEQSKGSIH